VKNRGNDSGENVCFQVIKFFTKI